MSGRDQQCMCVLEFHKPEPLLSTGHLVDVQHKTLGEIGQLTYQQWQSLVSWLLG